MSSNGNGHWKNGIDVLAVGGTGATFFDYLPEFVAIATGIWTLIRIYETETCKKIIGWFRRVFKF